MPKKLRTLIADAIEQAIKQHGSVTALPTWMSPDEAARYLGCTTQHLQNLLARRIGPAFAKFGRLVRYAHTDLDAYLMAKRVETGPVDKG